jgi:DNA-binding transcriptional regulator GbsR (MarR family)
MSMPEGDARFVENFGALLAEAGVPRMPARVFACVLADDDGALTATELAERLGVSAAAVSGAVRYLTQARMLRRTPQPGSRSDRYTLSPQDPWYEAITDRTAMLASWERSAAAGAELLGEDRPAGRRLRETEAFFAFLRQEIPTLMERWRSRTAG